MLVNKEVYLGDGLYIMYDGFSIWLRAPRPGGDHRVCLEPVVLDAFLSFVKRLKGGEPISND